MSLAYWFRNKRKNTKWDGLFDQLLIPFDPTTAPQPLRQVRSVHCAAFTSGNAQHNPLYVQAESSDQSLCSTLYNEDVVNGSETQLMQTDNGHIDTGSRLDDDIRPHSPSTELESIHHVQNLQASAECVLTGQSCDNYGTPSSFSHVEDFRMTEHIPTQGAIIMQADADALNVDVVAPDVTWIELEDHDISSANNNLSEAHTGHARFDTYSNPDEERFASAIGGGVESQTVLHNFSPSSSCVHFHQAQGQKSLFNEEYFEGTEDEFDDML